MRDDWLTGVLSRGTGTPTDLPWRPRGRAEAAEADREVREGLLQRVVGDVVVAGDVPVDAALRARALALLVPAGSVVLADAAAWVHLGPPLTSPREVRVAGTRLPDVGSPAPLRVSFSRVRPAADELHEVAGLTLTGPARTLLDVAAAQPHRAAWLRERMLAAGLLVEGDVRAASDRARGRGGVRTARRALGLPRAPGPAALSPSSVATP
ncbi:hypothetical protein FHR75_003651 [Kineococcus radiotolerans]|uniref:AbiEi antitoxin C-terminal domain-containing protein n=1 Tax=Kineococcus radiotolerans TaxID=131568 RepID=A0A7W4TQ00_KINRA|nr:hypothetical protein [Kineococcus radiotolerans]MBB2902815.1 hypothetical protein [Kineococcus radiotolerans]